MFLASRQLYSLNLPESKVTVSTIPLNPSHSMSQHGESEVPVRLGSSIIGTATEAATILWVEIQEKKLILSYIVE